MKKSYLFVLVVLLLCAFSSARAPLESYKRYMFVLVHGIGANTMIPHDYNADSEDSEWDDAPRKSSIWDSSKDDFLSESWFGNIGGSLQSRGFLGHVVWYDFFQPWKNPIAGSEYDGPSLSQYLGDRSMNSNPMGEIHNLPLSMDDLFNEPPLQKSAYFGKTAQSYWLHEFFPTLPESEKVEYKEHKGSFLDLAKDDWKLWNKVQALADVEDAEDDVPRKYIMIAHSMGGLTTRDYISGNFYKGDVDKLITLDSPHEGSAIANYVQYWNKMSTAGKFYLATVGALGALEIATYSSEGLMSFLGIGDVDAAVALPRVLVTTALATSPFWATAIASNIGQFFSGYEQKTSLDGEEEDHLAYGIDVMALNDDNEFGLYQSNTKPFLQKFNNRTTLSDEGNNGYQLPYFRVVSTSGVPTPGGPGLHKMMNIPFFSQVTQGLNSPYLFESEQGSRSLDGVSGFNVTFKSITSMYMSSLWNDWGSGFVPHWSSEAMNVKMFSDPSADTKRWNVSFDGDRSQLHGGLINMLLGMVATEVVCRHLWFENPALRSARFFGYVATLAAYITYTDQDKVKHLPSYIGFHGAMAKRVDENPVGVVTKGGAVKRLLDELVWEAPSVSIVYTPVDPQDRSNAQGGVVGLSTTGELVEYAAPSSSSVLSSSISSSSTMIVDVVWKGETEPHQFDLTMAGALNSEEVDRRKTINISGWHANSEVRKIILKRYADVNGDVVDKDDANNTITIDGSNCSDIPSDGWKVKKEKDGRISCLIQMKDDQKGAYTAQLEVGVPGVGETHGVMFDIGRAPGATVVDGTALFDVQDGDWDRYVTFKSRRKQVDKNNKVDPSVADMVDYRRSSLLVINQVPRLIEFEVDDLSPDRMNKLSVDFNDGSAEIEFEAVRDPNNFNKSYGESFSKAASHGFVNTADESYKLFMRAGGNSCETTVKNPVNAWGKWNLDLDKLQQECGLEKFQPFLEGRNVIKVTSENRWEMKRVQSLNLFIPGPPPTISLKYPKAGEVFCGKSELSFTTNLIYNLASDLTANDLEVYYMDGAEKKYIDKFNIIKKSNTAYEVSTIDPVPWPGETIVSITVKSRIFGTSATPYTYQFRLTQDCYAPTIVFKNQKEYNPSVVSFESYDQVKADGEHLMVQDEIIELKAKNGSFSKILSATKLSSPGDKTRPINYKNGSDFIKDDNGRVLSDGIYELSVRVHDDAIRDDFSETARQNFWNTYGNGSSLPDVSKPFAQYCAEEQSIDELSCMTHWKKTSTNIVLDFTAPVVDASSYSLGEGNFRYAGTELENDLVLNMDISDAMSDEEHPVRASVSFTPIDMIGNVVKDGHMFSQDMESTYEGGVFKIKHVIAKAYSEELKNQMNGTQPIPDGVYAPKVTIEDYAKNISVKELPAIFVDMTAPIVTGFTVPYVTQSGMTHSIKFNADESADVYSNTKFDSIDASLEADCGGRKISYHRVVYKDYPTVKFSFETIIPSDVSGQCYAVARVSDKFGNVRTVEQSFVVDFVPPEITYPVKSQEVYGRLAIKGSAGNPNLRVGGSFTKYELTFTEINSESEPISAPSNLKMFVPESRRCNSSSNVSCEPVEKMGVGEDVLGYWDIKQLPKDYLNKNYRIKVTTFNQGNYSESDSVDVFVAASSNDLPEIVLDKSGDGIADFAQKNSTFPIQWTAKLPADQQNGRVHMEIFRVNSKDQKTYLDVERTFDNVVAEEYYGEPQNMASRGVYLWIDKADFEKEGNIYHLKLKSTDKPIRYALSFERTKGSEMAVYENNGTNVAEGYVNTDDEHSSFSAMLKENEVKSFVVKSGVGSKISLNLQASTVTDINSGNITFMYSLEDDHEEYVFIGKNEDSMISLFNEYCPTLPKTYSADQFVWDGKNDLLANVPTGLYRVVVTLEGLKDGVTAADSREINVYGKPVVLSNVSATPDEVVFDVSNTVKNRLVPVNVTFAFNIDQDAVISAFVRNRQDDQSCHLNESIKLEIDGKQVKLDKFLLAGRKDNYMIDWTGHYNEYQQLTQGNYEFVVQVHGEDDEVIAEKSAPFIVENKHMKQDGSVKLYVDGGDYGRTPEVIDGVSYQVAAGMNDAILQFAPEGHVVVTDKVRVTMGYRGTQQVPLMPFERYSVGVQIHKKSMEFWTVLAASFSFNMETYTHKVPVFGWSIPVPKCRDVHKYYNKASIGEVSLKEGELVSFITTGLLDPGEAGSDKYYMNGANLEVLLFPKHSISRAVLEKKVASLNSKNVADMNTELNVLRGEASAHFTWAPNENEFFANDANKTVGLVASGHVSFEEYVQGTPNGTPPKYNSTNVYWDSGCDVGDDPNAVCMPIDPNNPPVCTSANGKCGNRVADEGEPLRGTSEKYNPAKHSGHLEAAAWLWKNTNGANETFDPDGCVGEDDIRHNFLPVVSINPTPEFWNAMGTMYGDGNLVNRYLTIDPANSNFLFCKNCPYSSNKTPYLNPNHPQIFDLIDAGAKSGKVHGQIFVAGLDNPSFQKFEESTSLSLYKKGIKTKDELADDVEIVLHYFDLTLNSADYSAGKMEVDLSYYNPSITEYATLRSVLTGVVAQHGVSPAIPLPGGIKGVNTSLPLKISMPKLNTYGYKKYATIAWPIDDKNKVRSYSSCGINGCGSAEADYEVDFDSVIEETENVQYDNGYLYKISTPVVTLGSGNPRLGNGFDVSPVFKKPDGSGFSKNQGFTNTIVLSKNDLVSVTEAKLLGAETGYKIDGDVVRLAGCSDDGCSYVAGADPVVNMLDSDGDGVSGEDGSIVNLGKHDAYDASFDSDGDLAMGEDPMDAFKIRLENLKFDFVPGATSAESYNERYHYNLSDLVSSEFLKLQKDNSQVKTIPQSVFRQNSKGDLIDNKDVNTQWESSNTPSKFVRTKLFYKDGKVNNDIKIVKSSGMDDLDATKGMIYIGPGDFNGRDRRLLEVRAVIPNLWNTDEYKLYASSEMGWIDLTPAKRVKSKFGEPFDGVLAYWDVETSGMHQLMLVRTVGGEKRYSVFPVFIGAVADSEKKLFNDALGRAQIETESSSNYMDVVPLGRDEIPQIIPANSNMGPVVKIYPSLPTINEQITLKLRFTWEDVNKQGWSKSGSIYVVSDGYTPQRVDEVSWVFYDSSDKRLEGNVSLSSKVWSYVIITGVVPKTYTSDEKKVIRSALGDDLQMEDGSSMSVNAVGNDLYRVDFSPFVNP